MSLRHRSVKPEQRYSKRTLFCQSCAHDSPADGDWIADDATERHRLLCPRCGDVVVDRPVF